MTAVVRVFSHAGVRSVPIIGQNLATSDQAFVALKQPYLGADSLSCTTGATDTSETSAAPAGTECLRVEVETGKTVHYEATPENATLRTATTSSPTLEGRNTLDFGPNWRLSVLEAS